MNHPTNRAERRNERKRIIAKRRFIYDYVWRSQRWNKERFSNWGKFAKWNMNCGCTLCHYEKYFKEKRKRREKLKHDIVEGIDLI